MDGQQLDYIIIQNVKLSTTELKKGNTVFLLMGNWHPFHMYQQHILRDIVRQIDFLNRG